MLCRYYYKNNLLDIYRSEYFQDTLYIYIANKESLEVESIEFEVCGQKYNASSVQLMNNRIIIAMKIPGLTGEILPSLISYVVKGKKYNLTDTEQVHYLNSKYVAFLGNEQHYYKKLIAKSAHCHRKDVKFVYSSYEDYWNCICGTHNLNCFEECTNCHIKKEKLQQVNNAEYNKKGNRSSFEVKQNLIVGLLMIVNFFVNLYISIALFAGKIGFMYHNTTYVDGFGVTCQYIVPVLLIVDTFLIMLGAMRYWKLATKIFKVIRLCLIGFMEVCITFLMVRTSFVFWETIIYNGILIYLCIQYIARHYERLMKIAELSVISCATIAGLGIQMSNLQYDDIAMDTKGIVLTIKGHENMTSCKIPEKINGNKVYQIKFKGTFNNLTSLSIPTYVESIVPELKGAFPKLNNISIDTNNSNIYIHNGMVMNKKTNDVYIVEANTRNVVIDWSTINVRSFYGCTQIEEITFTDQVEVIKHNAFEGCSSLKKMNFAADSLKSIDYEAFKNCTSLVNVTLPDSLEYLGEHIFSGDKALKNMTLPFMGPTNPSVIKLDSNTSLIYLFDIGSDWRNLNCYLELDTLTITKQTGLGFGSFRGLKVRKVDFVNDTLTGVFRKNEFYGSTIEEFVIPSGITKLDSYCFGYCTNLDTLTLNSSITEIAENAFIGAKINHIVLNGFDKDNCSIATHGNEEFINLL